MKIKIKKRIKNNRLFYGTVLSSELNIDIDSGLSEYKREYIPFEIDKIDVNKKKVYIKKDKLNTYLNRYNFLVELINKIKNNNEYKNIKEDGDVTFISYIDIYIDDERYNININTLEYEMLIHLSNFELYDKNSIEYIDDKILPLDN